MMSRKIGRPDEFWIGKMEQWVEESPTPDYPYTIKSGFVLCGYSASTQALLHEYGPFVSWEDVEFFAKAHSIKLRS